MAITKEDQNTFLMIAAILIVCLIALISILNIVWRIISPFVNTTIETISYEIQKRQPIDYNFTIPQKKE